MDPGVEKNSQMGDLASFRNDLYFGSQHLPGGGLRQWADFYNDGELPQGVDLLRVQLGTLRGASVWRLVDFDTPQERVQLLYGDPVLTLYRPDRGRFTIRANNLGLGLDGLPRFGLSGWNNPTCNHYYWINQVHQEELFVSSFDECALLANQLPAVLETEGIELPEIVVDLLVRALINPLVGADLWRWYSRDLAPLPDTLTGARNKWNYGFRTMWSDADGFFLGSANPHNLAPKDEGLIGGLTSPTGVGGGFGGGWELLERESGWLLELTDFLAIGDVDADPGSN